MGGKKKGQSGLGKAVIKDRFQSKPRKADSFLHTSELQDGYDWGRLNLQSVTEQSNLDDFLLTAQLAGTEFVAEKLNVRFVNPAFESKPTSEQLHEQTLAQDANRELLKIPRRPKWDVLTSPEELDRAEKDSFLDWRRQLAALGEKEHIVLTPFEKNLEFWRQLWRVIERSDIVVQIVDARNPLLYRCEDLEVYVKEISVEKVNVILINKADFLTDDQRKYWFEYFHGKGMEVVFWSAVMETERLKNVDIQEEESDELSSEASDEDSEGDSEDADSSDCEEQLHSHTVNSTHSSAVNSPNQAESADVDAKDENAVDLSKSHSETAEHSTTGDEIAERLGQTSLNVVCATESGVNESENSKWRIMNGEELTEIWKQMHNGTKVTEGVTTVGLVGYPNVGKSSTINALLKTKKVPVSATPGRTKHFQTLYLENDLLLCDCPGLVMPSFVSTRADMVVSGILPIDQMRDYVAPVLLVCQRMGRAVLEATYGLNLPLPMESEDMSRPPTAHELLNAYGYMRGFMTQKGQPDMPRSSRIILKDFVNGKLIYRHPPPGVALEAYGPTSLPEAKKHKMKYDAGESGSTQASKLPVSYIDKLFFSKARQEVHTKGSKSSSVASGSTASQDCLNEKPWKKHHNKGKKEKLRRTYAHLDQH